MSSGQYEVDPDKVVDIATWSENLYQFEFGRFAKLEPHHERILRYAFHVNERGRLPFRTVVLSEIKKSGKTQNAGMVNGWFADQLSPPGDELIIVSNDYDQASKRVYKSVRLAHEWHPVLKRKTKKINDLGITFKNGTVINPISRDYASAAGANFGLVTLDEPWGFVTEASQRLFTELTPTALTRPNSVRLMTGYAGWSNESKLWERIIQQGLRGRRVLHPLPCYVVDEMGMFMYFTGERACSWQQGPDADEYYRQEAAMLAGPEFDRVHRNIWHGSLHGLDMEDWEACLAMGQEHEHRVPAEGNIWLCVGIDAGWKKDRCAIRSVYKANGEYFQGPGISWKPQAGRLFSFKDTVEAWMINLKSRFRIDRCFFDPTQMIRSAEALTSKGIKMVEYTQTEPNLLEAGNHFYDLMRERRLILDPNEESGEVEFLKQQARDVKLKITNRGVIIKKQSEDHAIDDIMALVFACMAAKKAPDRSRDFRNAFTVLGSRSDLARRL